MTLCIMANENIGKAKERLERPLFANPKYLTEVDFKEAKTVYFDDTTKKAVAKYSESKDFKDIKFVNIDDKPKDKPKNKTKDK